MNVAVQKEDIQLLNEILQERLLAEFSSVEGLQVKCALKNDELMILTQHDPQAVIDTGQVFAVVEQALQWQSHYPSESIKCFVRISGEKLPYAKHTLNLPPAVPPTHSVEREASIREPDQDFQPIEPPDLISTVAEDPIGLYNSFADLSAAEQTLADAPSDAEEINAEETDAEILESEEKFDPFAGGPDLRETKVRKFPVLPQLPSLPSSPVALGLVALVGIVIVIIFGVGAYTLTTSCLMFKCQALANAEKLKTDLSPLLRHAKSERELQSVKQQIDEVVPPLQNIPEWSPNHQEAEEITTNFSEESAKIQQVVTALSKASQAMAKTSSSPHNLQELKNQQNLWHQAITPMEAVKPSSDLYALVHPKLPSYRQSLVAVNQQLLREESVLKKLASVKDVAEAAIAEENTAKSLNELRKVAFDWQVVVNTLKSIPPNSPEYTEATALLAQYQPKLTRARNIAQQEVLANEEYQKALSLARAAQADEAKNNQLPAAVSAWQQALQSAKQIPQGTLAYNQAQSLITAYSSSLLQAQSKLQTYTGGLEQARTDLNSTCNSGTEFCTFTINDTKIIVTLTPEYDQALQNPNDSSMQNHLNKLREVLKVISENANRSLVLYNSQKQVMYERLSNSPKEEN